MNLQKSLTSRIFQCLKPYVIFLIILIIIIGYNIMIVSKIKKDEKFGTNHRRYKDQKNSPLGGEIIYKMYHESKNSENSFNNLKINFIVKKSSQNGQKLFLEQYNNWISRLFPTLRTNSNLIVFQNSSFRLENDYISYSQNKKFKNKNIGEWYSIISHWSRKCKRNSYSMFLNNDHIIIPQMILHLISIRLWMKTKRVLGVQIGENFNGILMKCENIPIFLKKIKQICQQKSEQKCLQKSFKIGEKKLYTYRYNILDSQNKLRLELKTNKYFDYFNCKSTMFSPCDQSNIQSIFKFRDNRIITTDIGLSLDFIKSSLLNEIGISILKQRGFSCIDVCEKNKKKCLKEGFVLINNCDMMKDSLYCRHCMTFDEGNDQPYMIQDVCRLKQFNQLHDTCNEVAPSIAERICPCHK
eukprot:gene10839-3459_t